VVQADISLFIRRGQSLSGRVIQRECCCDILHRAVQKVIRAAFAEQKLALLVFRVHLLISSCSSGRLLIPSFVSTQSSKWNISSWSSSLNKLGDTWHSFIKAQSRSGIGWSCIEETERTARLQAKREWSSSPLCDTLERLPHPKAGDWALFAKDLSDLPLALQRPWNRPDILASRLPSLQKGAQRHLSVLSGIQRNQATLFLESQVSRSRTTVTSHS